MNKAIRNTAASFGIFAGIGGLEHGYFEILQGNARPPGLMIASMGNPCIPEEIWHACEPAMTILPNFLVTGILSILLGVVTILWTAAFLHRKNGGAILMLLSFALLLFGGGIFPPVIGIFGGWIGTRIHAPLPWWRKRLSGDRSATLARMWPWAFWALILFFGLMLSQILIGHFFPGLILEAAAIAPLVLLVLLFLSALSAFAYDVYNLRS